MVVSDLARQGVVDKVIESIGEAVRPAEGLFLDATNYTLASGATPFVSDQLASIRGRFVNFKQESIDEKMQSEMGSELTTMAHSATFELDTGFGMNAIPVQF